MKNRYVTFTATLFALTCFGFMPTPKSFSVVPPPDGGYPGGNTAEGQSALLNLTTGGFNTAVGFLSLRGNTNSSFNTAIGAGSLLANTAFNNTATGAGALLSNTTGSQNTATGAFTLLGNTTGSNNTVIGARALLSNINGGFNTAIGFEALRDNTDGGGNVAIGASTLASNTTGINNVAIGSSTCVQNTEGDRNVVIGPQALNNNATGNDNIAIGFGAGGSITTASNTICIGSLVTGFDVSNGCFIGNIRGGQIGADAVPVSIDSSNKLGTITSSKRFKKDIKSMNDASTSVLALRPVTFRYKSDNTNTPQFGLIAEEVAEVNPDLVVRDKKGELLTVRYDAVNAMLINEFLKEHRKVEKLEATVAQQRKGMEGLAGEIEAQTAQIQKMSALIEMTRPTRQQVALKVP